MEFTKYTFDHYYIPTLLKAPKIVMKDNIIQFCGQFRIQSAGKAMGKHPAPVWATIFEGIHKLEYFARWEEYLGIFKSFIDYDFGLWLAPIELSGEETNAKWIEFQVDVNDEMTTVLGGSLKRFALPNTNGATAIHTIQHHASAWGIILTCMR